MALINCPECNKEVSNSATMCPHCGFGVAKHIKETENKQREAENQQRKKMLLEQKQAEREKRRERRIAAKRARIIQLKKIKAFWVLLTLIPYSIIAGVLPDVRDYIILKQNGVEAVATESIFDWLVNNDALSSIVAVFTILLIPSVLYIITKNINNNKTAKALLLVGLGFYIMLLLIWVASLMTLIANPNINFEMVINDRILIAATRFIIPFCAYTLLFYKATHVKK